jgi:glutamate---cysteine ligase / carboxylate-amine ligase
MRNGSRSPAWARWSGAAAVSPWTVGVEEEVLLLDPLTGSVANRIDEALEALPPSVARHASAETHACVVELRTDPHRTVGEAAAELSQLRASLDDALQETLGLCAAVAGTHPLVTGEQVAVSSGARYRQVSSSMRALTHREPTMAQHVHVAVPGAETAVRALDGLRSDLPLLLALSGNSPYWRGEDSGFASIRTPIFSMFPRVGIPRRFGTYTEYVGAVDPLLGSEAIPEPGFLWWDVRLRPHLGTVEVRIMDAQSRVADAAALAAVVHCLVCLRATGERPADPGPEVLAENRFLAARDGTRAQIIDVRTLRRRSVRGALTELLGRCEPIASSLGCADELAAAITLADDPGAARQRRLAARDGVAALPAWLGAEFAAVDRVAAVP